ncbi:TetR family transcriptional regulator [Herbidospora sp. NEAU-GS84]|uniref:TetR family transcriptional regulator n=1 Tax=Herbidospora solisilvae TaxID=2696284 RepID=A0A7C9JC64_9ACTN|nr:TetR family transcriptional regulator [Herbidospora solisilvae]NAS26708.1 TetR family transcriptional regulator [Herbidospora solisilvae]
MNSPGLRERKKEKTRRTIQEHALRLFAEQGYDATTIEQIADAAEVSPSTLFRYFPTKEDIVVQDDYDPLLVERLIAQPPEVPPVRALRNAFGEAMRGIPDGELGEIRARARLQMGVPAIRARIFQNMLDTMELLAEGVARRTGADPASFQVRVLIGAVMGTIIPVLQTWATADEEVPFADMVDEAFSLLEAGLPIEPERRPEG